VLPTVAAPARCAGKDATLIGTDNADVLFGTRGNDVIVAKAGSDLIRGRAGRDIICAGAGDDHVTSGLGEGHLEGGSGDDVLVSGPLEHVISGNRGNDLVFPAGGIGGRIDGDDGTDWITFVDRPCGRGVKVDLTEHAVRYSACKAGWGAGVWRLRGIERAEGSERADTIVGNGWPNGLWGMGGEDELLGRSGNDFIDGGASSDVGRGGEGTDRCRAIERRLSCEGT
jgi:Ca2+-binding RTX toxin-like protein